MLASVEITEEVLRAARVIWGFHVLGTEPAPGDVILALGTNDLRVAEYAAELYLRGFGKWLVCSGGIAHAGDLLETPWDRTEAEMYADVAVGLGVPRECVLLEKQASNTAENFGFTRRLLAERGIEARSLMIAVKPFMQRRAWATKAVQWPEIPATMGSPALSMDEYFTADLPAEKIINIFMGDLQRMWIYGRRGWSAPVELPAEVVDAYRFLKAACFDKPLLQGEEELR